ncbi:TIGR04282 family arsenosugar biosynthesis glycosyltransferase [Endozoicomonas sp. SM1973]|uniref:TIGR04282 family arsenosugar biosynthesis glycosyltransferase n=1 Tax=Spartinivicinus marinus TaxID=2994442 RepID=A0A853IFH5_9GAMM|nr:TIGR04282 family arsenosugar biosynthesis glycosyltransferase [Spartinivicinus marinus]MCX4024780.1 TIGR04282 family arsenosugar biosynthesis glycosyltransferase [Spartinivicinus marinus]NYZ68731.1 TIGR04282 family arsenosugar biosynthesis glycosyltransferase [Spartinivicinus marinus]
MAKPPIAGKVKTRLTPYYSAGQAANIYKKLLLCTAKWINELPKHYLRVLALAEQLDHDFFNDSAFSHWERYLQQGKDLGERMANVAQHYMKPNQPVILVGGDCPVLNASLFQQVLMSLSNRTESPDCHQYSCNKVAIVPAEDGGYVLIAMQQFLPYLFENIQWGTEQVLEQTTRQLQSNNVSYTLFPALWDVDRPEDYQRWCNN